MIGVSDSRGILNQEMTRLGPPTASQWNTAVSPAITSVTDTGCCLKKGLSMASGREGGMEKEGGMEREGWRGRA